LLSKPAAALVAANRRRLLRRGRPYGEVLPQSATEDDGEDRGLMFMCLNGDIERQFEFVQQNWINGSGFSGLYDERDPLIGTRRPGGLETVQTPGVRERIKQIPPFVTVKGGGYFFMPGLSALRYLASNGNGRASVVARGVGIAEPVPTAIPLPPLQVPSFARRTLTRFDSVLSALRVAWAGRYPLLSAAMLAFLPLLVAFVPNYATSLFLAYHWTGVFFISLVASVAAFAVMINLRLALMYGWRSGLAHGIWLTETTWWQLLAFQALAVPTIVTVIVLTATDWTRAGGGSMFNVIWQLAPAAIGGCASALLLLMLATTVQASRPGSRPDLFFPPNPLFEMVAGPDWRGPKVHAFSRWLSRASAFLVDNIPPALGHGYIDYRHRLLLPGHVFATVLAGIIAALYVAFGWFLQPALRHANGLPPVGYLLFIMIIAGWILSATAFLLDRYRLSTLLAVTVWLVLAAAVGNTDHVFKVGAPLGTSRLEPQDARSPLSGTTPLSPAEVLRQAHARHRARPMVIVAAEGQGITSSAWTAKVLTYLTDRFHAAFTDSLTLLSTSSGASLGALHFVDRYQRTGFNDTADVLQDVVTRASAPSSGEVAWGFAYPDLLRAFVPFVVPAHVDRGWAMESAWRRQFPDGHDPTLAEWRQEVGEGWRPATAFGVTVVETGSRAMLATYDLPPGAGDQDVTGNHDISMMTAARLSAGFPFISPVPQAQLPSGRTGLHLADGGYWDNYGIVAAIDWLRAVEPELCKGEPVLLIQILSSSPLTDADRAPKNSTWTLDVTGPIQTLIGVRYNAQPSRNGLELDLLNKAWQEDARTLVRVAFRLDDARLPTSWNLGEADAGYLDEAWRRPSNRDQLENVRKFLSGKSCTTECVCQ
jgi:hypothetical protein